MVNFIIVENSRSYHDVMEEFVELYNKGVLIKDIREQLNLSKSTYRKCFLQALEEKRIKYRKIECRAKKDGSKAKHYTRVYDDYYQITKNNSYIASMIGEDRAKMFVRFMEECDWDLTRVQEMKRRVYDAKPTRRKVKIIEKQEDNTSTSN